jgi:hypothetical protein
MYNIIKNKKVICRIAAAELNESIVMFLIAEGYVISGTYNG